MDEDQVRFYNFLKHYSLDQYHDSFVKLGVSKIAHLKHISEDDLIQIGLQRPERARLHKKIEENFSTVGKLKKRFSKKDHLFDGVVPPRHNKTTISEHESGPLLINPENIEIGKKIGEGVHGSVHEAVAVIGGESKKVAVKIVYEVDGPSVETMFIKEVQSMVQLDHTHIIKLFGISLGTPLMMIEELAPLGNLHSYLVNYPDKVHLGLMYRYIVQVADAMSYLESRRMIHRDLATRNILLLTESHIKLADFGLARLATGKDSDYKLTHLNVLLPVAWMSPEAISFGRFSTQSDVWSYGVFIWEVYSLGARPFEGCQHREILDKLEIGFRLSQPKLCPPLTYKIMNACWALEPHERPTFANIFSSLRQPEYHPEVAMVAIPHASFGELQLVKNDLLFVIDRPRGDWFVGMTITGKTGSFRKDCVTTDMKIIRESPDSHVIRLFTLGNDLEEHAYEYASPDIGCHGNIAYHSESKKHPQKTPPLPPRPLKPSLEGRYEMANELMESKDSTKGERAPISQAELDNRLPYLEPIENKSLDGYLKMNTAFGFQEDKLKDKDLNLHVGETDFSHPRPKNESPSSLIDIPMSEQNLPPPILPTAEALRDYLHAKTSPVNLFDPLITSSSNIQGKQEVIYQNSPWSVDNGHNGVPSQYSVVTRSELNIVPSTLAPIPYPRKKPGDDVLPLMKNPKPIPRTSKPIQHSYSQDPFPQQPELNQQYSAVTSSHTQNPTPVKSTSLYRTNTGTELDRRKSAPVSPYNVIHPSIHSYSFVSTHTKSTNMKSSKQKPENMSETLLDILCKEFPDVEFRLCENAVQKSGGVLEKAREDIKVQQLLGMRFLYIKEEDCLRALTHCQGKMDRAAVWLIELSETISARKT